jgi:hypothetical protein
MTEFYGCCVRVDPEIQSVIRSTLIALNETSESTLIDFTRFYRSGEITLPPGGDDF